MANGGGVKEADGEERAGRTSGGEREYSSCLEVVVGFAVWLAEVKPR